MPRHGRRYTWPGGATYVIQGTVAEDATAGTHVCTLTVSPGAGSEMSLAYGQIVEGNTATAQTPVAKIDDGTNVLVAFIGGVVDTSASIQRNFPTNSTPTANTNQFANPPSAAGPVLSGTMRLILQVSTAAVSVTQTFAVVLRVRGRMPSVTFADTVGTPTVTVNTNKVIG